MYYPGDSDAGRPPRRRRSPSGQVISPIEGPAAGWPRAGLPGGDRDRPLPPAAPGPRVTGGRHRPTGGSAGKGPLRGFPPAPGQPPPLYPPGQFSAWNRIPRRDGNGAGGTPRPASAWQAAGRPGGYRGPAEGHRHGGLGSGEPPQGGRLGGPGYLDAEYSALAVSEPAADVISTQSWEAVDDSWAEPASAAASGPLPAAPKGRVPPGHRLPDSDADSNGLHDSGMWDRGSQPSAAGSLRDTGLRDTGLRDTGIRDTGLRDTSLRDTGLRDTSLRDTGLRDTGLRDTGIRDTGLRDTGIRDTGIRDGMPEAAPPVSTPGSRHGSRNRARPRKRRIPTRVLLAGALAVAVVVGAAVTYLAVTSHHSAASSLKAAASKPKPTVDPDPPASLGQWGYIASRTTDPQPLTLAELFPAKFSAGSVTYTMTVNKSRIFCNLALVGSQLQAAAQQAGCTQAMIASYLSSSTSQQVMGTIGVLNLSTAAGSQSTGAAAGPTETIAQLPGPSGPTASLTKGTGIEAAEVKGHYLVLVWAEFANLQPPSTQAQRQVLESFINLLIEKTANVSLAIREVTGKPPS